MDEVLIHIPRIRTIQLFHIFLKEEEFINSGRKFQFEILSSQFFKRINELEKLFKEEEKKYKNIEEKIINLKKDNILEWIENFKIDFRNQIMERGIYPKFLHIEKCDNDNKGICGWINTTTRWEKNISHYTYEKKLNYCFLTEEEKNFKFEKPKKNFDYLSLFFKKEYKNNIGQFLIPTDHIVKFKRNIIKQIKEKCCEGNFVCPMDVPCDGHKFVDYIDFLFSSNVFAVEEKKVYYRYFLFKDIVYKNGKIHTWDAVPSDPICLKHLSYSCRLAFFN